MIGGWEATVEAQIRLAQERGDFDDLPGAGKPLPGRDDPYDEMWWIKGFLEREALPTDLLLPTPLQLRRKIEQLPAEVRDLPTEQAVRALVQDLNAQIVDWLRAPVGPQIVVRPVNADAVVHQWRDGRSTPQPEPRTEPRTEPTEPGGRRPRRRWRWRAGRGRSQQ